MDALNQLAEAYDRGQGRPGVPGRARRLPRATTSAAPRRSSSPNGSPKSPAGPTIYLKREDLNHTGAHKINNALGQVLLAQRMGKTRVIAETGAGQHGVATATACALFGLECTVYMGEEDIRRQKLNVFNMRTLGATVVPVTTGSRTLRDATNEAMRDWMGSSSETHYTIGSVVGPHPFPMIVRDFQAVIGRETRGQCLDKLGRLPDAVVACVGGGSNAAGMFYPFIDDDVGRADRRRGGRPGPDGRASTRRASRRAGPGVLHGSLSYVLQDDDGQTAGRPLDLRRARLPGRRPRAQLLEGRRPGPLRERHRRRGPRRLPHDWPGSKASSPPSSRATPWPRR